MKKKIICLLIACLMVVGCIPMTVSAAETERKLDDYLTIHYNFENDMTRDSMTNGTLVAEDVAPSGNSYDDLKFNVGVTKWHSDMTVSGGTATTLNGGAGYSKAVLTTDAGNADVMETTGEGTYYVRYKVASPVGAYGHTLFAVMDNTSTSYDKFTAFFEFQYEGTTKSWRTISSNSNGARRSVSIGSGILAQTHPTSASYDATTAGAWVNLFVIYKLNDSNELVEYVYAALDGYVPTLVSTKNIGTATLYSSGNNTALKLFSHSIAAAGTTRASGLSIDDFRYYNTDLTMNEVKNLLGIVDRDINENLTIHYDFDNCNYYTTGATDAVQYVPDVAPAGQSADTLSFWGNASNRGKLTGGDGTVTGTAGTFSNFNGYQGGWLSTAAGNADVKATTGEGTFYMRFKLDTPAKSDTNPLYFLFGINEGTTATSTPQIWMDYYSGFRSFSVNGSGVSKNQSLSDMNAALPTDGGYVADAWVNLFVVFSKNDSGNLVRSIYMGIGDSSAPTLIASVDMETDSLNATKDTSVLTLYGAATMTARPSGMMVDDFRYYDTALAKYEFDKVFDTGSFDGLDAKVENVRYQLGTQTYENGAGVTVRDLRLIAEIDADDYESFIKAGFTVKATGTGVNGKRLSFDTYSCYDSLLASDNDGNIIKVDAMAGKYFIAVVLRGLPTSITDLEIETSAYVVTADKTLSTSTVSITVGQ